MDDLKRTETYLALRRRALEFKDRDDYLGIFTIAQVLFLIEEIERKDRVICALGEEWACKRITDLRLYDEPKQKAVKINS